VSISFDRAADYYDATRALPPEAMDALVARLVERLRPTGRVLEIGIGTGRFAVPLRAGQVNMFGLDLAPEMLRRLRQKDSRLPVALGDATRMPFADGRFGAAVGIHVLHLIPSWREALSELVRVVRRGGLLLFDIGHSRRPNPVEERFFAEAGVEGRNPGVRDPEVLEHELELRGAVGAEAIEVQANRDYRVAEYIDQLESGMFSRCWSLDAETRRRAAAPTRAWAAVALGDIHRPVRYERTITIRAYRVG
jgi:SAM-dependent methyltransferase